MSKERYMSLAKAHMEFLCKRIDSRRVGSKGNIEATEYFDQVINQNAWSTKKTELDVIDWITDGATITNRGRTIKAFSSPYSLGCSVIAPIISISSVDELKNSDITDKVVLLYGDIAKEQIMPKNFVFYNPDEHKTVVSLLEEKRPKTLICATRKDPYLAGGSYPFPMFEDGDFDIPSVYIKDIEAKELPGFDGEIVEVISKAQRSAVKAYNITGSKRGKDIKRIVISAHIDAKDDTPGALDNAGGVTVLLLLSEMLKDYEGHYSIELAPFNGEDYYSVPGQMKYIEQNEGSFDDVVMNINIDGVGYIEGGTAFSLMELPVDIREKATTLIDNRQGMLIGEPWYQGDHGIFLQYGRPAIAVTSEWILEHMDTQDITHTKKDDLDIISYESIVNTTITIHDLIVLPLLSTEDARWYNK